MLVFPLKTKESINTKDIAHVFVDVGGLLEIKYAFLI